jgi:hypothetical protein
MADDDFFCFSLGSRFTTIQGRFAVETAQKVIKFFGIQGIRMGEREDRQEQNGLSDNGKLGFLPTNPNQVPASGR